MEKNNELNEFERVERLKKVDLHPNDILIISVDVGKLGASQIEKYFKSIKDAYRETLTNVGLKDMQLIVCPNTMDHSILHVVEEHI